MIAGVESAQKGHAPLGRGGPRSRTRRYLCLFCAQSATVSSLTASPIFFKLEPATHRSFQRTWNPQQAASSRSRRAGQGFDYGVAGNHAQGVAYHAGRLGIRAEIWMPLTTPLVKVSATRQCGAEVVLHGTNFDEAYQGAREHCRETGAHSSIQCRE